MWFDLPRNELAGPFPHVSHSTGHSGYDSYMDHHVWDGSYSWGPAWIAQLGPYIYGFLKSPLHGLSTWLAWLPHSREVSEFFDFLRGSWLPPREKQKLPGFVKPGLRSPGTFLPSHSVSQSNGMASADPGGGERDSTF